MGAPTAEGLGYTVCKQRNEITAYFIGHISLHLSDQAGRDILIFLGSFHLIFEVI